MKKWIRKLMPTEAKRETAWDRGWVFTIIIVRIRRGTTSVRLWRGAPMDRIGAANETVDMPLRLDNAKALPT